MKLASETMMKLMAYADGELEPAEKKEVEALLAKDEDAVRFVEQIAGLGDFVKMGHATRDAKVAADFDIADAVMAKVKETKPDAPEAKKSNVVSLEAKRASRTKVAVAGVLALAASVVIFTRPQETPMPVAKVTPPPSAETPAAGPSGPGVEVDPVESPGHTVSVFYLPGKNEMTSVVVWVDETGEK